MATLVVAGCYVNFGEKDLGQFAPTSVDAGAPEAAAEAPDGFFGGGDIIDGGLL